MQFALAQVAGPNSGGTFGTKALSGSSGSWNNPSNVAVLDGVYSVSDPLVNSPTKTVIGFDKPNFLLIHTKMVCQSCTSC